MFLETIFHKLMINFTWWVNRKDAQGRNVFQGGFLGLDNIGVFDRSHPLPTGGFINQADGTAWMATLIMHMLEMTVELAHHDPTYIRMFGRWTWDAWLIASALGLTALDTRAQADFPNRPIRIIVPYSTGTGSDALVVRNGFVVIRVIGRHTALLV